MKILAKGIFERAKEILAGHTATRFVFRSERAKILSDAGKRGARHTGGNSKGHEGK